MFPSNEATGAVGTSLFLGQRIGKIRPSEWRGRGHLVRPPRIYLQMVSRGILHSRGCGRYLKHPPGVGDVMQECQGVGG